MRLVSIQIAKARPLDVAGRQITTGIFKGPVDEVAITGSGLSGDAVVNTKHHGGPDQAVYVYSDADYEWWQRELGRDLAPGMFGENLTFSSFGEGEVMIGDRWKMGDVLLETTAPRIPCATFGAKMGDPKFPQRFRSARRPGFYARVLQPGLVRAGMAVRRHPVSVGFSLLDLFDLAYDTKAAPGRMERALQAPIALRSRVEIERRLQRKR